VFQQDVRRSRHSIVATVRRRTITKAKKSVSGNPTDPIGYNFTAD